MILDTLEFRGSPREIGEAHGESCRDSIRELYQLRLNAALRFSGTHGRPTTPEHLLTLSRQCLKPTQDYDPLGWQELEGLARGSGLPPQHLLLMMGMTDLRDVCTTESASDGEGCSSFLISPGRSKTGQVLAGQNWDLQTDNTPFVRLIHRLPHHGPETWSLTLTGCLSLVGINSEGMAVGTTNLRTRDARPGVIYQSILHKALTASTFEEAVEAVRTAPRAGAHYYFIAAADGRALGLECSATRVVETACDQNTITHCNHALTPEIQALECEPPSDSSAGRQEQLVQRMENANELLGVNEVRTILASHEGGPGRCLCRHDENGVSTNACIVMEPARRCIHACRGQPHVGYWRSESM